MPAIHNGIGTTFRSQAFGGAPSVNPDFVSTWDTTKTSSGSSTSTQVKLPLLSSGIYNFDVDWGDGNTDTITVWNQPEVTHTYSSSGIYTITISGQIDGWAFVYGGDRLKISNISNWGSFSFKGTTNTSRHFDGCQNLTITAADAPNINTTSLEASFRDCDSFTTEDFSNWDTSTVTSMLQTFQNCNNFNGNVSGWVHSGVLNTSTMFSGCPLFNNSSVQSFDMSGVTNISRMFSGATAFNQDLDMWDVGNVTNWNEFMRGASSFNSSLAGWTVKGSFNELAFGSTMTNFTGIGLDTWNTTGLTSLRNAFANGPVFNPDISGWDVSNVTSMELAFTNCDSFNRDLSTWDITSVSNFTNFMANATGLSTVNYDALLVGWEATLQATWAGGTGYPYTINIHFGGSKYTGGGAADAARASLITNFGWTITDGGSV